MHAVTVTVTSYSQDIIFQKGIIKACTCTKLSCLMKAAEGKSSCTKVQKLQMDSATLTKLIPQCMLEAMQEIQGVTRSLAHGPANNPLPACSICNYATQRNACIQGKDTSHSVDSPSRKVSVLNAFDSACDVAQMQLQPVEQEEMRNMQGGSQSNQSPHVGM